MLTEYPWVTVIIPCYNQAPTLAFAIDSALAQTYPCREIVVVDDGSTDGTAAVAAGYGSRIAFVQQPNRGLSAARNAGIRRSRGTFIGLIDADDRWLPDKLAIEVPRFSDERVGLVHSSYRKFPSAHPRAGDVRKTTNGDTDFHELLGFNIVGAPVSALFRRSIFDRVGGFDEDLKGAEDWDLWIRIAAISRVVASGPITAEYRLSDDSMSRNYERMYRCLLRVSDKNRGHHSGCRGCRRALRRAKQHARSYYCDLAARDAFRSLAAGRRLRYLSLRIRGLLRNPRIALRLVPAIARRIHARLA
jgi:glycosyltransferase involved in cell wall biosynthesis